MWEYTLNEVIENVRQPVLKKLQFQGSKSKLSSNEHNNAVPVSTQAHCLSSRALISQLGFVVIALYWDLQQWSKI